MDEKYENVTVNQANEEEANTDFVEVNKQPFWKTVGAFIKDNKWSILSAVLVDATSVVIINEMRKRSYRKGFNKGANMMYDCLKSLGAIKGSSEYKVEYHGDAIIVTEDNVEVLKLQDSNWEVNYEYF